MNKSRRLIRDQILWIMGLKKSLRTRRINYRKEPLKVFWWRSEKIAMKNFGDEITVDILNKIFGYRCTLSDIENCELISTGSILEIAMKRKDRHVIKVWGSGFIKAGGNTLDKLDGLDFYAVRGQDTQLRVKKDVVLGDPGLLVNLIYNKSNNRSSKIGVVIHYADLNLPIVKKFKDDARFTIISPLSSPENVTKEITSCKLVISSSLHGLIFSDSFGIPNIHIKFSDRLSGGVYKFLDYYSAVNKNYCAADIDNIFNDEYLEYIRLQYKPIKNLRAIQRRLIRSFPL